MPSFYERMRSARYAAIDRKNKAALAELDERYQLSQRRRLQLVQKWGPRIEQSAKQLALVETWRDPELTKQLQLGLTSGQAALGLAVIPYPDPRPKALRGDIHNARVELASRKRSEGDFKRLSTALVDTIVDTYGENYVATQMLKMQDFTTLLESEEPERPAAFEKAMGPLSGEDESKFQIWYADWASVNKKNPDPDFAGHHYDYRRFWIAAGKPERFAGQPGHLPDDYYLPGHPSLKQSLDARGFLSGMIQAGAPTTMTQEELVTDWEQMMDDLRQEWDDVLATRMIDLETQIRRPDGSTLTEDTPAAKDRRRQELELYSARGGSGFPAFVASLPPDLRRTPDGTPVTGWEDFQPGPLQDRAKFITEYPHIRPEDLESAYAKYVQHQEDVAAAERERVFETLRSQIVVLDKVNADPKQYLPMMSAAMDEAGLGPPSTKEMSAISADIRLLLSFKSADRLAAQMSSSAASAARAAASAERAERRFAWEMERREQQPPTVGEAVRTLRTKPGVTPEIASRTLLSSNMARNDIISVLLALRDTPPPGWTDKHKESEWKQRVDTSIQRMRSPQAPPQTVTSIFPPK